MLKLASVVNSAAAGLMECVETLGGNGRAVTAVAGVPHSGIELLNDRMPVAQFSRMIQEAAIETDCHDISLRFARRYDIRRLGPLGYLLHHAETLGEALRDYCQYFYTLQSHTEITFQVEGNLAYVGYRVNDGLHYDKRHDAQFSTAIILCLAEEICGRHWQLNGIEFEHEKLQSCAYSDLLGTYNIEFCGKSNSFSFPAKLLDMRNRHADRQLTSILRNYLGSTRLMPPGEEPLEQITETIIARLKQGKNVKIDAIARLLGTSVHRIQHECERQKTTFSTLRLNAIMEIAIDLITHESKPLTEIALLLGFSELSAFSRAFKSHMGVSPSQYRKRLMD